jgi:hypothetical protein
MIGVSVSQSFSRDGSGCWQVTLTPPLTSRGEGRFFFTERKDERCVPVTCFFKT